MSPDVMECICDRKHRIATAAGRVAPGRAACSHMLHALKELKPLLPMDEQGFMGLTDEQVQDADQFILRFSKLQDVVGARIFPALLDYLEEPYAERPMLDKLNRLEQLGYLTSVEAWQYMREIRNRFTHDYPDDPERNAANLNLATPPARQAHSPSTRAERAPTT